MKKVYVNVITRVIMEIEKDINIDEVISEMDYNFIPSNFQNVKFIDTEIVDFEVKKEY